jgi:GNAT superfamily N-acetyltransferase
MKLQKDKAVTKISENDFEVEVYPATAERWKDIETLFGPKGAYAGCWCMFWRLDRADFKKMKGEGTKAVLKDMTSKNEVAGLLAYIDGQPIGWCSIGPRKDYAALENSRILKRIDDTPVWSIVCFFVAKPFRSKGVMSELLRGAVKYAKQQGAQVIEGYPIDMQTHKLAGQILNSYSGYMGIASIFRAAGFTKVADASETQLIMRYTVKDLE